jgi:Trp operon repressor
MMQQSKHIFLFSFLMQCLMQKSKHAKWRMIMQMLKSNYIESETNAMLKKINMDDYQFYLSARVQ